MTKWEAFAQSKALRSESGVSWSTMKVKMNGGEDMDTNVSTMTMIFLLLKLKQEKNSERIRLQT
uniref:Uncharacterized protein n=1 Tax=Physcomitrium patens TaxID=3218 RepID=A0A2K1KM86_PHYPA|nr:hypothetical protein PHYPA_005793 [Physcomitrium patens]